MSADRYAHPTMGDLAKNAAEFVAPRTVGEGLTVANVFGDIGELTPFAPAVPFLESRLGLKDWDDETIAAMALLGLIPFGGKVAREAGKGIRKTAEAIERIPKGNKGGFIVRPDYQFKKPNQEAATKKLADAWTKEVQDSPKMAHPSNPQPTTYTQQLANDITDQEFRYPISISKTYTDPETGKTVVENAAKLDAILPENASEAAFVRHQKTPYDNRLKNVRHNMETEPTLRNSWFTVPTMQGYEQHLPIVGGGYANRTDRAKNKVFDDIEKQMPGYRQAALVPDPRANTGTTRNLSIYDPTEELNYENLKREIRSTERTIEIFTEAARNPKVSEQTKAEVLEGVEKLKAELREKYNMVKDYEQKKLLEAIEGLQ